MFVIKHKNIFFVVSGVLILLSLAALFTWKLPLGIDFTGGSALELLFVDRPSSAEVEQEVAALGIGQVVVRPTDEKGYLIRTPFLAESQRELLVETLGGTVERFSSVGPTIGRELRRNAVMAIGFVVVFIVLYIAFVFRHVSEPVASWKYGIAAIIALLHDVIIPTGLIAVLGVFGTATADSLFVMALLAILGLSVNDTIVVFDRIRERLRDNKELNRNEPFSETVGVGLSQTYTRSINTSLTTLFVLLTLFFIGGETIHNFVLTLIVGTIAGTYSSIFLASPLLVVMARKR